MDSPPGSPPRATPRVGLATGENYPQLGADDGLLLAWLSSSFVDAQVVVWNEDTIDWRSFDLVVIRSCWDYHLQIDRFARWIDQIERAGVRLANPPELVRWNLHKSYLLDLAKRGIAVPPTVCVPRGETTSLDLLTRRLGANRLVVKPAISASAHRTWRFDGDPSDQGRLDELIAAGDVIAQPFVDQVADGELSLIYFDGAFSHAVRKIPDDDDFRVQVEHGGRIEPVSVSVSLLQRAQRVIDALGTVPLYARVDGIPVGDELLLMELELIEPELYLRFYPDAAERIGQSVAAQAANGLKR